MRALAISAALIFTACGAPAAVETPPDEAPAEVLAPPASERIYVRADNSIRTIQASTGKTLLSFVGGATSGDWTAHYAVEPDGDRTEVRVVDPRTAKPLRTITIPGDFQLPAAYGPAPSGLSAQATWLVLTGAASSDRSAFAIIDTKSGTEKARIELRGRFTFDAINDAGSALYLIEHPRLGSTGYNVRLYDLRTNKLEPQPIGDPKASGAATAADLQRGLMDGLYHSSVRGKYGWLFSLYFHPQNGPFIHALNLDARTANCILDLPRIKTNQGSWALAMDAKEDRLYAVSAANGSLAVVNTRTLGVSTRSYAAPSGVTPGLTPDRGSAVLSADGSRLYATSTTGIWVINTHDLSLKAKYLEDRAFRSIAISADGQRLYGLDTNGSLWLVEPGTGRPVAEVARLTEAQEIVHVE